MAHIWLGVFVLGAFVLWYFKHENENNDDSGGGMMPNLYKTQKLLLISKCAHVEQNNKIGEAYQCCGVLVQQIDPNTQKPLLNPYNKQQRDNLVIGSLKEDGSCTTGGDDPKYMDIVRITDQFNNAGLVQQGSTIFLTAKDQSLTTGYDYFVRKKFLDPDQDEVQ
jgi:hypothetical protein